MRFVFDTSVLVDYLRDDEMAANALFVATEKGNVFISLISFMELWLSHNRSNAEIQEEIAALQELCKRLEIRIVPCTHRSQQQALALLERNRSPLGRNALPDSLIIATGITRRAYLVTRDGHWFDVAGSTRELRVLSPEELVEEL
ncbi:MAG: PIN domain-containing protein [Deltaproteobacteria bacterium]|nr:PIN domain-containing protein [Deltaproteobacteria bacterium]